MLVKYTFQIPADDVFFIAWKWPTLNQWPAVLFLGLSALFGQYFVTKAFGADKAPIVSVIGYANIVFSIFIGMALGDAFPELLSLAGIICIIGSGAIISIVKSRRVT
jgi:drug/metabolite transporter (DMT)-like permease